MGRPDDEVEPDYEDQAWINQEHIRFASWWSSYMRKADHKTELAEEIAFDAWLASRWLKAYQEF